MPSPCGDSKCKGKIHFSCKIIHSSCKFIYYPKNIDFVKLTVDVYTFCLQNWKVDSSSSLFISEINFN